MDSVCFKMHYMVCEGDARCWSKGFCRKQTNSCANKDSAQLKTVNHFQEWCVCGWNHVVELGESRGFVAGCPFNFRQRRSLFYTLKKYLVHLSICDLRWTLRFHLCYNLHPRRAKMDILGKTFPLLYSLKLQHKVRSVVKMIVERYQTSRRVVGRVSQ